MKAEWTEVPCAFCGAPAGKPCKTDRGTETRSHRLRQHAAAGLPVPALKLADVIDFGRARERVMARRNGLVDA